MDDHNSRYARNIRGRHSNALVSHYLQDSVFNQTPTKDGNYYETFVWQKLKLAERGLCRDQIRKRIPV